MKTNKQVKLEKKEKKLIAKIAEFGRMRLALQPLIQNLKTASLNNHLLHMKKAIKKITTNHYGTRNHYAAIFYTDGKTEEIEAPSKKQLYAKLPPWFAVATPPLWPMQGGHTVFADRDVHMSHCRESWLREQVVNKMRDKMGEMDVAALLKLANSYGLELVPLAEDYEINERNEVRERVKRVTAKKSK